MDYLSNMDPKKKMMLKREALKGLSDDMKSMESEGLGIMPSESMEEPDQLAEYRGSDFARPSESDVDAAIKRFLESQQPSPSQSPMPMKQSEDTPGEKAEGEMGILEKPFKEGMEEQQRRRRMMDELFKNRE